MLRECLACLAVALVTGPVAGCSLILDFSDDAIPVDAAPDAPYTAEQCDYLEPNNSFAEAAAITAGEAGTAAICAAEPADVDFYKFTVPAGTASVSIGILFSTAVGDLDLRLLDGAGTQVAQSVGFADNETLVCPAASPACPTLAAGDYVVEVKSGLAGATSPYQLALTLTPM